jgi:ABC-type nitrate/sulfonate/bicarbonate transport system ATPase subunit
MRGDLIALNAVEFCYLDGHRVIAGFSYIVKRGKKIAVLGLSGSGKTTLLRLLAGALTPSSGTIMRADAINPSKGGTFGYIGQGDGLFPWRDIENNIALCMPRGVARPRVDLLHRELEALNLSAESLNKYPRHLSSGMRKRIELLRYIIARPPVLFADEPFAALDAGARGRAKVRMIGSAEAVGGTVVIVSHDLSEAIEYADELLLFIKSAPGRIETWTNEAVGMSVKEARAETFRIEIARAIGIV